MIDNNVRKVSSELIELASEGMVSWEDIAMACISYMSEANVADMVRINEFLPVFEDEEYDEDEDHEY